MSIRRCATQVAGALVFTSMVVACGSSTVLPEEVTLGTGERCRVAIAGAVSDSWAGTDEASAPVWSTYWSPGVAGSDSVLSFSCNSGSDRAMAFEFVGVPETTFPFGPGAYPITPGNQFFDTAPAEPGHIKVALLTPGVPWNTTEGTITIEAWDSSRLKGRIDLILTDALGEGRAGTAAVVLNFPCVGTACG